MKERELIALGPCAVCGKRLLEPEKKVPLFYHVQVTRLGFDMPAVQRQLGLALQIGGVLAHVMGPDEDLAKPIAGPVECVVHEECASSIPHLMILMEERDAKTSSDRGVQHREDAGGPLGGEEVDGPHRRQ